MSKSKDNFTLTNFISPENKDEISSTLEPRKDSEAIKKELNGLQESLEVTKKGFEDFKKEQNIKLIEFLGIFTAILAFITISSKIVIDNLDTLNVLLLMPSFALVLMLFVLCLEALIIREKRAFFWIVLTIFSALYVLSIIAVKLGWFTS
ncbi:MAG: hypothetical protein AABW80_01730 [Nanoarchaeota archaeon]